MAAIQFASGLPDPSYFAARDDAPSLPAAVSEALFAPGELLVNLFHLPAFALLALLWFRALAPRARSPLRAHAAAFAIAALFGIANEASQLAVPTRDATLLDAGANLGGAAVGLLLVRLARGPVRPPLDGSPPT
jgi:hypothetical protein